MGRQAQPDSGDVAKHGGLAESALAAAFENGGWNVRREAGRGPLRPDLLARRRGIAYAVGSRSAPRSGDRLSLLAQAVLGRDARPVAVLHRSPSSRPRDTQARSDQVIKFAQDYAPIPPSRHRLRGFPFVSRS
jgi:hypothetical protein